LAEVKKLAYFTFKLLSKTVLILAISHIQRPNCLYS